MARRGERFKKDDQFITATETNEDGTTYTIRVLLPRESQMFALADEMLGHSSIRVVCEDGESRLARIPGRMRRRRFWIREGDLLIIKLWDFQPERCDVEYRYRRNQALHLKNAKLVPELLDIF